MFCGDLFNSRYSINVNTLNIGIEFIQNLAYNFEKVILIEGNHDTYYKNSNSVNSVTFLKAMSKTDNIFVVDELPLFAKVGNVELGFYPWGFTPDNLKDIPDFKTPTYGFGHFEMNGIELAGQISVMNKFNIPDMFVLGDTLFSGHYHRCKDYFDSKTGKVLHMVGSALQLDWGDCDQKKNAFTLDLKNGKLEAFENKVNARFEKVFYSVLKNKKYTAETLKKLCKRNFVKFVIDLQYDFNKILDCSALLKKFSPLSLEFEYLISSTASDSEKSEDELSKCKTKTNKEYFIEYLESIFDEYKKIDTVYDLQFLKSLACSYYDKATLAEEEREEKELA